MSRKKIWLCSGHCTEYEFLRITEGKMETLLYMNKSVFLPVRERKGD